MHLLMQLLLKKPPRLLDGCSKKARSTLQAARWFTSMRLMAGLVGAFMLGKRVGLGREAMAPHSLTLTMVGASMLWVGWFGFNAGSALEANGSAALAFANTLLATAAAVVSWSLAEWVLKGKPSMLGAASGAVAGLVAITPAAGLVGLMGGLVIGLLAGVSACGA
jgi:ammonium transporter, Amt family